MDELRRGFHCGASWTWCWSAPATGAMSSSHPRPASSGVSARWARRAGRARRWADAGAGRDRARVTEAALHGGDRGTASWRRASTATPARSRWPRRSIETRCWSGRWTGHPPAGPRSAASRSCRAGTRPTRSWLSDRASGSRSTGRSRRSTTAGSTTTIPCPGCGWTRCPCTAWSHRSTTVRRAAWPGAAAGSPESTCGSTTIGGTRRRSNRARGPTRGRAGRSI